MKWIITALLLLSRPLLAQVTYASSSPRDGAFGSLVTLNDAVQLNILGAQWATAKVLVGSTAGTATMTVRLTVDGVNWNFSNFFGKRLDAVNSNPTVQTFLNASPTAGAIWEFPLPSNAVAVQVLCGTGGTSTPITIVGGIPYTQGIPVTAVIFDTTSAVNTAIDTGTVDMSGWEYASVSYNTPAGGSGTISMVDDAGTSVTMFTPPASAIAWYPFAIASPSVSQVTALPPTGSTGALPIQKRMRFQSIGVAALTSRIRIEVRR